MTLADITTDLPISIDDAHAARERISPHLTPTPLRRYPQLSAAVPFLVFTQGRARVAP